MKKTKTDKIQIDDFRKFIKRNMLVNL